MLASSSVFLVHAQKQIEDWVCLSAVSEISDQRKNIKIHTERLID